MSQRGHDDDHPLYQCRSCGETLRLTSDGIQGHTCNPILIVWMLRALRYAVEWDAGRETGKEVAYAE